MNDTKLTISKSSTSDLNSLNDFPLECPWNFFLFSDWKSLKSIGTLSSVKDFWSTLNFTPSPSSYKMPINFGLFRNDSKMSWEHPTNQNGGRWIICIDLQGPQGSQGPQDSTESTMSNKQLIDNVWLRCLLYLISGMYNSDSTKVDTTKISLVFPFTGATINIRNTSHRINIWSGYSKLEDLKMQGAQLRNILQLPKSVKLEFKKHSDIETETYKAKVTLVC